MACKGDVNARFAVRRNAKQVKANIILVAPPRHGFQSSSAANFFVQHFFDNVGVIKMAYRFQNTRFSTKNTSERLKPCCSAAVRHAGGIVPLVVEVEQALLFIAGDEILGHPVLTHEFDLIQIKFIVSLSRFAGQKICCVTHEFDLIQIKSSEAVSTKI